MKIAIFGSTSQIAMDFIKINSIERKYQLTLLNRKKIEVETLVSQQKITGIEEILNYEEFDEEKSYFAILNFIGAGSPKRIRELGAEILEITEKYDNQIINYLKKNNKCRYVNMSSGAVYGGDFKKAVTEKTKATYNLNQIEETEWYGVAKFCSEVKHRRLRRLSIVDLRIFNYLSESIDIKSGAFISDLINSVLNGVRLETSTENITRDYIGEKDFYRMIDCIMTANQRLNLAIDCYSKKEASKIKILEKAKKKFSLNYSLNENLENLNATGIKKNYFTRNRKAAEIGYKPGLTTMDLIIDTIEKLSKGAAK